MYSVLSTTFDHIDTI